MMRVPPRTPRAPRARAALIRADRLVQAGRYGEALPIYIELGREAEKRGLLEPAANAFLRASQCVLELGRPREAADQARHAMDLLALAGRAERIHDVAERAAQALEAKGNDELAAQLRQEAGKRPEGQTQPPPLTRRQHTRAAVIAAALPNKCPSCGAPVLPSELDWVSPGIGRCAYCGSIIKPNLPHLAH